jgi:RimJ/RimL family protein N-acetyltransferase
VRRADAEAPATLVAGGGYFGPPDEEGTVEIGYSVAPEWRGRGIARELAAALVARAWATPGVRRVVARTDETNAASMAVLHHCGFRCTGPGMEPGSRRFEHERGAPMAQ